MVSIVELRELHSRWRGAEDAGREQAAAALAAAMREAADHQLNTEDRKRTFRRAADLVAGSDREQAEQAWREIDALLDKPDPNQVKLGVDALGCTKPGQSMEIRFLLSVDDILPSQASVRIRDEPLHRQWLAAAIFQDERDRLIDTMRASAEKARTMDMHDESDKLHAFANFLVIDDQLPWGRRTEGGGLEGTNGMTTLNMPSAWVEKVTTFALGAESAMARIQSQLLKRARVTFKQALAGVPEFELPATPAATLYKWMGQEATARILGVDPRAKPGAQDILVGGLFKLQRAGGNRAQPKQTPENFREESGGTD